MITETNSSVKAISKSERENSQLFTIIKESSEHLLLTNRNHKMIFKTYEINNVAVL